jgi:hypothetical protein
VSHHRTPRTRWQLRVRGPLAVRCPLRIWLRSTQSAASSFSPSFFTPLHSAPPLCQILPPSGLSPSFTAFRMPPPNDMTIPTWGNKTYSLPLPPFRLKLIFPLQSSLASFPPSFLTPSLSPSSSALPCSAFADLGSPFRDLVLVRQSQTHHRRKLPAQTPPLSAAAHSRNHMKSNGGTASFTDSRRIHLPNSSIGPPGDLRHRHPGAAPEHSIRHPRRIAAERSPDLVHCTFRVRFTRR